MALRLLEAHCEHEICDAFRKAELGVLNPLQHAQLLVMLADSTLETFVVPLQAATHSRRCDLKLQGHAHGEQAEQAASYLVVKLFLLLRCEA